MIIVPNKAAASASVNNINKKVILKNFDLFTDCITEIKYTQVVDTQKIDVVILIYKLV